MSDIRILVAGAAGRMGAEVVRAVAAADGMSVVAAVDVVAAGLDVGTVAHLPDLGVAISPDLGAAIASARPDVMVDFTRPDIVMPNLRVALAARVPCVVGTTGLTSADLDELRALSATHAAPVFTAANFALGAVLMMKWAEEAARYFGYAEVVEYHHEKKLDAPSGTALRTAERMAAVPGSHLATVSPDAEPSRGRSVGAVRVHAVRMPGWLASQDVVLGGPGETLTIRHQTMDRGCFMPGVLLAIRRVRSLSGLVVGLDQLLQEATC